MATTETLTSQQFMERYARYFGTGRMDMINALIKAANSESHR